jgi:hypothetical protein
MISARLTGTVLVLWLFLALLVVAVAFNAAHFSPWEFFIPASDPMSWVAPSLLIGPPLLVAVAHRASPQVSRLMGWALTIILGLVVVAIFALFFPSAYLGS